MHIFDPCRLKHSREVGHCVHSKAVAYEQDGQDTIIIRILRSRGHDLRFQMRRLFVSLRLFARNKCHGHKGHDNKQSLHKMIISA